ncbi:MAG: DUF664 domain-containing protein [Acidimicrobiia bacterium]
MRVQEPADGSETDIVVGWLRFHRDALANNATGLSTEQLTAAAAPPSAVTILGLVRHMTEMERVYGAWAIGGSGDLAFVYGDYVDGGPEWDLDVDPSMAEGSMANWRHECDATDRALASAGSLDSIGSGNGRSVRWNLHKLVGEYARHNGDADIVRERIDGSTGE